MKTYLSIDIGTSSTKLSLFDEHGRLQNSVSAAYPVEYPRPEWAEQEPEEWWRAVCRLGPEIMQHPAAGHLAGISLSGQTPLCVPVDETGRPLRKAILWLDRRSTAQVGALRLAPGEQRCRAISRNRLDSYFGGPKWLWFRQEEAGLFARTWKILQASSFVQLRLTGQAVIDPAQAGLCSPCFNAQQQDWDAALCAEIGIPLELLPTVRPAWEVVGAVSATAARQTGLPEGLPVVCGGGDFACACLGAGIGPHSAALMLGTAGNLLFPGVENEDPRLLHTIHLDGSRLPFGGVMAGGNLNWLAGILGGGGAGFFEALNVEAAQLPPGSEGLLFLPYLMGERTPIWDPSARGAFIGLSAHHTRAHLYRAMLEGIAFAFRQIQEIAGVRAAGQLQSVTAIDGGARSALWRQILADVLGVPVIEGGQQAGTALGSAFLAALGTGGAAGFAEIQNWVETGSTNHPDAAAVLRYEQNYPVYAGLYEKLKPDFDQLGAE